MAIPSSVSDAYWEMGQVHVTTVVHIFEVIMFYFRKALELWLKSAVYQFCYYKNLSYEKPGPSETVSYYRMKTNGAC